MIVWYHRNKNNVKQIKKDIQKQRYGHLWAVVLKKMNAFFFKNDYQQLLWEERQVQNVKLEKTIFRSRDMAIFGQLHQEENLWGKSGTICFLLKKISDFFFKNHYQQLLWEERQLQNVKLEKKNIQKQRYGHLWAVAPRGENVGGNLGPFVSY